MSAQSRASFALTATTSLSPFDALGAVKYAAARVKGGGASLLTTGLQNLGAQVNIEWEGPQGLGLSITSGRRIVELCTFAATTTPANGATFLRVGGLETYRTTQSTVLGFIPVGPKMIAGMAPYKRFLDEVATAVQNADGRSQIGLGEMAAAV